MSGFRGRMQRIERVVTRHDGTPLTIRMIHMFDRGEITLTPSQRAELRALAELAVDDLDEATIAE